MGQNVNLLIFEKDEQEAVVDFTKQLLAKLSFVVNKVVEQRDYNASYTEMFFNSSQQYRIMVGQKDNFVILMEEGDRLIVWDRSTRIQQTTKDSDKTVFWMMTSDTVEIMLYHFYKNGKLLRAVEFGDDGEQEGPDFGPRIEGEELPFEKDGLSAFSVLKNFCHDYYEFNDLEWRLFEVEDLLGR